MANIVNLNRRRLLRRLAVGLTLPWLESVPLPAADPAPEKARPPVRFAVIYTPNGFWPDDWTAEKRGSELVLGKTLDPLNRHRDIISIPLGLSHPATRDWKVLPGHTPGSGALLNGVWLYGRGLVPPGRLRTAISVDQLMAQRVGQETPLASLVLGRENDGPAALNEQTHTQLATHISFANASTACPRENRPLNAFQSLFPANAAPYGDAVFESLWRDLKRIQPELSVDDRARLDEYSESVRSVEQRSRMFGRQQAEVAKMMDRNEQLAHFSQDAGDINEHIKLMGEIICLAFRTRQTRIATYMIGNEQSGLSCAFVPGCPAVGYHGVSHHPEPGEIPIYQKVNRHLVATFANLLDRMRGIREGEGTLLDHSIVMFCSSYMDGLIHDKSSVPIVIAGRGGGGMATGFVQKYSDHPDRRLNDLYLAFLHRMGVTVDRFHDGIKPLAAYA